MIKLIVTTEIAFKNNEDFNKYIQGEAVRLDPLFKAEIEEANLNRIPVKLITLRPEVKAVTTSIVEVVECNK